MTTTDFASAVSAEQLQGQRIEEVAKTVLEKDSLSDEELELVFKMAVEVIPTEIQMSASETRQVRQYEPNSYQASMKLDCSGMHQRIVDRVMEAKPENRVAVFTECKRIAYGIIAEQYKVNENYLRKLIQQQQLDDGIKR